MSEALSLELTSFFPTIGVVNNITFCLSHFIATPIMHEAQSKHY
jgi:hypothetical protein